MNKPSIPNKLLEAIIRESNDPRMADHLISLLSHTRKLNSKEEVHPNDQLLVGREAIAKYLKMSLRTLARCSKEMQDLGYAFKDRFHGSNVKKVCAWQSDAKAYRKYLGQERST